MKTRDNKEFEATINSYHFVWFPDPKSPFSKGETIEAYSMLEALVEFEQKHGVEPYYVTQKQTK